jgi:hypothetical protein
MARRTLAGGATAGAASRVRFAPTSNNLLVSSWDSVRALSPPTRGSVRHGPSLLTPGSAEFDGDANNCVFFGDYGGILGFSAIQLISESNLGALKSI